MFTKFDHVKSTTPATTIAGDPFVQLKALFNSHCYANKTDAPLICPSTFNGSRCLKNHSESHVIGLDIDDGITLEEAFLRLTNHKLGVFIYTTPSSRDLDRYRIFLKFSRPVTSTDDYKAIWRFFNALLDDSVDRATQHAACLFYIPAFFKGADNKVFTLEGDDVDVDLYVKAGNEIIELGKPKCDPIDISDYITFDPAITDLDLCPFARQAYIDRYTSLSSGQHYHGLYYFMAQVAGYAKSKQTMISVHHLTLLAKQLDQVTGNRYPKRSVSQEAGNALAHVYGGEAQS